MDGKSTSIVSELNKAKQLFTQSLFQDAINTLAGLKERADSEQLSHEVSLEIDYLQAVAYRYLKEFSSAQEALSRLFASSSTYNRGVQEQGHLFLAMGRNKDAAQFFYQATLMNPALVGSWHALNTLYQQNGNEQARQHVKDNLAYWSALPKPLLGAADLLFSKNYDQADKVCRQFLQQHKHHVEGLYILALIGIQTKIYDEAEFLLESCCELSPKHTRAKAEYIGLLNRVGKSHQALKQAKLLLATNTAENTSDNTSDLNYQLLHGVSLVGVGQVQEGIDTFEQILVKEPERASLWLQLGHARKTLGQLEGAIEAYQKAINYRPTYGDAYWSLANTKAYQFPDDDLATMKRTLNDATTPKDDRIHLAFALGKGYEDKKIPSEAFQFYQLGNQEKYSDCHYSPEQFSEQVERQIKTFTAEFFASKFATKKDVGCLDTAPIFVVGLPRAGSTLLEQILSSHSQIDATRELHNVLSLVRRLQHNTDYPNLVTQLDNPYFERFGQQYIEQTKTYRQSALYFIDKMPNNFLHIGLIKLILPNAKIIDARRDPMDCCYSGYKQLFGEGQDFSYDLHAIGSYYRDYEILMDHWDKVLPDFVLKVQHEDVIDDLHGQVHRMLTFCGLPFESACLEFHRTERAVHTPSADQVRQPINKKGIGRWKAVEDKLLPLKGALAGVIKP